MIWHISAGFLAFPLLYEGTAVSLCKIVILLSIMNMYGIVQQIVYCKYDTLKISSSVFPQYKVYSVLSTDSYGFVFCVCACVPVCFFRAIIQ